MFRKVLVALDGTPFGEHALPLAVSVARRSGASLDLAHVHVPTFGGEPKTEQELSYLEEVAGRVQQQAPEVPVRTALLSEGDADSVAASLAAYAEDNPVDLIVMNSHARGGLARWWMGNVAEDLVRKTAVPVLATPYIEHDPGWHPEQVLRHMLIPLDGSPLAEQVFPAALTLGSCWGMEITLLRVVEPVPVAVADPVCAPAAAYDPGLPEKQREAAEMYLTRVASRLRGDDARLQLHTRVVLESEPAEAICSFLRRHSPLAGQEAIAGDIPIDLVALATHGREGLPRLLLGSIADRVLQHTPVPLLLQRPVGAES
jgi:nucleotide-binding universal stress UspA family protein